MCNVSCAQGDTPVQCGANLSTAMAAGGDSYLCAGRYDGPFTVTQDTALYGAGNGTDNAVDTILTGAGTAMVMDIYTASKLTLAGLRLTDGYSGSYGGNMRIDNAAAIVTASNCVFNDGVGYRGGGIHMNDGLLNASKCQFLDNTSTSYGGALYVYNGTATITDTIFSGNEGNYGGGFYAYSASQISVSGSTFTLNTATTGGGGAISGYSGSVVTVTTSTFTSNQAMSGGAVYVDSGQTVTLDASVSITGNSAVDALGAGGGGVLVNSGTFNRGGATITNNSPDNCVGTGC